MNRKIFVYSVSAVLFILVMIFAWFIYDKYSDDYKANGGFVKYEAGEISTSEKDMTESDNSVVKDIEDKTEPVLVDEQERAPDFTVYDADGNGHTLSQRFGKPIVLNFWATFCRPCKNELPYFEKMFKEYGDDVEFMMINLGDSHEDIYKFMSENGYTFPVYYDVNYEASYLYNARYIPLTVVIYEDASICVVRNGAMELEELQYYINSVLEGKK